MGDAAAVAAYFLQAHSRSWGQRLAKTKPLRTMLGALATQLTIAREHALLGDYSSSQVYFDGVLSQISRYGNH